MISYDWFIVKCPFDFSQKYFFSSTNLTEGSQVFSPDVWSKSVQSYLWSGTVCLPPGRQSCGSVWCSCIQDHWPQMPAADLWDRVDKDEELGVKSCENCKAHVDPVWLSPSSCPSESSTLAPTSFTATTGRHSSSLPVQEKDTSTWRIFGMLHFGSFWSSAAGRWRREMISTATGVFIVSALVWAAGSPSLYMRKLFVKNRKEEAVYFRITKSVRFLSIYILSS